MNRFWSAGDDASEPVACLFDIDGTLVDSNYLHIEAWDHAFSSLEKSVPAWRIHRLLGKDSSFLLSELLGNDNHRLAPRAKELHSTYYRELAPRLRVFDGARELVHDLKTKGVRVVLATSAPEEELSILLELLAVDDDLYAVTSAEDVENAKPDPSLLKVALRKAQVAAADAIMIGDAAWDIEAAERAGIRGIGVLSGGIGADELSDAGAISIYSDVADIRANLDQLPLVSERQP